MDVVDRSNPWWLRADWEGVDPHLARWVQERVRWVPKWIHQVPLEPPALNFVYGPRQTGKTTGVKLLIKDLLRTADPHCVAYVDLDAVISLSEFRRALSYIAGMWERRCRGVRYLFLDEVTSLPGWWRVVKYFVDSGVLGRAVVTATGSSAVGLAKTPERFPGRRGRGRDVLVLPLDFPSYVEVHGGAEDPAAVQYLFEEYLKTGGFPKSINKHADAEDALVDSLVSEAYRHKRSPQILKDVVGALMDKMPSATSYHAVAQEVGVSHITVKEYVEFLVDAFVAGVALLLAGGRPQPRREKKVFFRDPLLYRALSRWTSREVSQAALLEHVVQEHLYRKYGAVYYYRNKTEIDVIAGPHKIEVKSARPRRGYPRDVATLTKEDIPRFLLEEARQAP